MKTLLFLSFAIVLASFSIPRQDTPFGTLRLLLGGTWKMKTSRGTICEQWVKKDTYTYTGNSYRVNAAGTDTVWMETLELTAKGNTIVYSSLVNGQNNGKAVPFTFTERKGDQIIFTNPEHDFPQRIVYEFINSDSIHAWIDGKINGRERKSDFYYSRK